MIYVVYRDKDKMGLNDQTVSNICPQCDTLIYTAKPMPIFTLTEAQKIATQSYHQTGIFPGINGYTVLQYGNILRGVEP